jgi:hypothetical protein
MKSRLPLSVKELESAAGEICSSINQKKWVVNSLKLVMKEVAKQKVMHGLVQFPSVQSHWPVRAVLLGRQRIRQSRQRRWVSRVFPVKGVGNPKHDFAWYLMIKLGEIYVRATGQRPTSGGIKGSHSRFKRFAEPLFVALGIGNFRNRVREYIAWRKAHNL